MAITQKHIWGSTMKKVEEHWRSKRVLALHLISLLRHN